MRKVRDYFTTLIIVYMTGINFSASSTRSLASVDLIEGDSTSQAIKSAIYVVALFLLLWRWRRALRLSTRNMIVFVPLVWVFASTFWSGEPSVTLRRAVGLLGTTVIALYLASYYDQRQFAVNAARAFLIVYVLSFFVIVMFPERGISWEAPGWRGIYFTKNGLGANALMGGILFAALLGHRKTAALGIIGFILSLILLIGSRSVTSWMVSIFALSLWIVMLPLLNRNMAVLMPLLCGFLILFAAGIWLYSTDSIQGMLMLLGKDPSLTGRVQIWDNVLLFIRQRPWLGYGYGGLWLGANYGIGSYISAPLNYYVVNAHNGYLDALLEIGIIGLSLVAVVMVWVLHKLLVGIGRLPRVRSSDLWPVVFLMALIVYNSTEAMLLVQNSVAWIVVAFLGFGIAKNKESVRVAASQRVVAYSHLPL